MALEKIITPLYPNVPFVAGVPPLLRAQVGVQGLTLLAAGVVNFAKRFAGPQWGIFDQSGRSVLPYDSVLGVEFKKDYRISDFPVEKGKFSSYNKVETPFDARVVFTVGGSDAERALFLSLCGQIAGSLELFSVVMPEVTYPNANVTHYDFRRSARNGVSLLTVDVWLQEVRITAASTFSQSATEEASGASPTDLGTVQPYEVDTIDRKFTSEPLT